LQRVGHATGDPERAVIGRGHVLDGRRQQPRGPQVLDRARAHDEGDIASWRLVLREDAHGRDAGAARDEQEVLRGALDHEGAAEGTEQVELVTGPAGGDPLTALAERFHDELDLARAAIDAIEGIRPAEEWVESRSRTDVDELAGSRLGGDARGRDVQDDAEIRDLAALEHLPGLEHHGSAVPTANV